MLRKVCCRWGGYRTSHHVVDTQAVSSADGHLLHAQAGKAARQQVCRVPHSTRVAPCCSADDQLELHQAGMVPKSAETGKGREVIAVQMQREAAQHCESASATTKLSDWPMNEETDHT